MLASIIIRTLNEEQYLSQLLGSIEAQKCEGLEIEVIIVDSGSTDGTLTIASEHNVRMVHIEKSQFSFGRSLNLGCEASRGDFLVFISGHCVPVDKAWLKKLIQPLQDGSAVYTYGRQVGGVESKFSEGQLFNKYFPSISSIPQEGFFTNNANAALLRSTWSEYNFDEELTGLEDMHLAKRLVHQGHKIGYVAEACVFHYHHESWSSVRRRYEREAIALQHIMPEIQISFSDFLRYFASAVLLDAGAALQESVLWKKISEIIAFRFMQFWGAYRGNHEHRRLSKRQKEAYFYPRSV